MTDCWVSPYGQVYECPPFGHDDIAQMILADEFPIDNVRLWIDRADELGFFRSYPETLERRGWVRYTSCTHNWAWRPGYTPTTDQLNAMFDFNGFVLDEQ